MHARLVSYLRDNCDQIIEHWLTEVEIPAPNGSSGIESGVVPYAFYKAAFDSVLGLLENGSANQTENHPLRLNSFLGLTCDCRERCFGGRVCMELHDAGLHAYMSVFDEEWDTDHEFNELDREHSKDLINHALSSFFGDEIDHCQRKTFRKDCPFVAHN